MNFCLVGLKGAWFNITILSIKKWSPFTPIADAEAIWPSSSYSSARFSSGLVRTNWFVSVINPITILPVSSKTFTFGMHDIFVFVSRFTYFKNDTVAVNPFHAMPGSSVYTMSYFGICRGWAWAASATSELKSIRISDDSVGIYPRTRPASTSSPDVCFWTMNPITRLS